MRRLAFPTVLALTLIAGAVVPVGAVAARQPRAEQVAQWSRFEATYVPPTTPANPFDPEEIDVRAEFSGPGPTHREVLGFWFQDYERSLVNGRERLTPLGDPAFRIRFTPERAGQWRWRWVIRTPGHVDVQPWQRLRVSHARDHGFLRVSERDPRMLAFDDGSPYFAVGENTGWYDQRGTYAYDDWFGQLAAQDANFGRLWMSSWAFGIEWKDTGLGNYTNRLDRAWQLDQVVDEAERQDIYVMLALLNHGAFSRFFNSEWADNPYNVANGGPLNAPVDFFTDATARRLFEQRLRYIVARWGSSTHVMAWELWNEVDLTLAPSASITAWHAEMAAELRALDPYDHLVTTSHALFPNDPAVWQNGGVDFTQLHFYADQIPAFARVSRTVTSFTRDRLAQTGKPVLFGELGIDSRGPVETVQNDPEGIGVHDGLWAGVVSGGIGTAMPWWWDSVIAGDPQRYYPMFGSVARFVDGVQWDREAFTTSTATVSGGTRPVVPLGLQGKRSLLLWLKDDTFQWNTPQDADITGATLQLPGRWCGDWYDTWTGEWQAPVKFRDRVTVPTFRRDIALRARQC